jgi:hypothetical protein
MAKHVDPKVFREWFENASPEERLEWFNNTPAEERQRMFRGYTPGTVLEKVLVPAGVWVSGVLLLGLVWFTCSGSPGLCERLCAPHGGVESVGFVSAQGHCSCECQYRRCVEVWPWTRAVVWLTQPAEE